MLPKIGFSKHQIPYYKLENTRYQLIGHNRFLKGFVLCQQDKYLHTNCLAALANMSSQFRSLHPYVCQRLVSLFEKLSKRHTLLCESLKMSEDLLDESENDMPDAVSWDKP